MTKLASPSREKSVQKKPLSMRDWLEEYPRFMDSLFSSRARAMRLLDLPRFEWPSLDRISNDFMLVPEIEVTETNKTLEVTVDLPGVEEKDISIELRNTTLWIRGEKKDESKEEIRNHFYSERRYGSFERAIQLPCEVNKDNIEASLKDGTLLITLPKTEAACSEVKKIKIKH